jgi:microcystin-dependent protein
MTISPSYPDLLQNGNPADASQVMADFYQIQNDVNANAAASGANTDITSLTGLTTPLGIAFGGTGASTASAALLALAGAPLASPAFTGTPTAPTPSPGDNSTNLATTAFVAALIASQVFVAPGTVVAYAGATTSPPGGYLFCDGSAVSRTTYANLYAAIGGTWGNGDGSTTFNVPDMRRRVPMGSGGSGPSIGNTVGSYGGEETHQLNVSEMPSHTHPIQCSPSDAGFGNSFGTNGPYTGSPVLATQSTGGNGAHNNVQPSAIMQYYIKT